MNKLIFISILHLYFGAPENIAEIIWEKSSVPSWSQTDPILIAAIVYTETGGTWNPRAYNPHSKTVGLMQIAPFWRNYFDLSKKTLFDPRVNIEIGITILHILEEQHEQKCTNVYSRWQCKNIITPLHYYRCNFRSALSERCQRSVNSVLATQRKIHEKIVSREIR